VKTADLEATLAQAVDSQLAQQLIDESIAVEEVSCCANGNTASLTVGGSLRLLRGSSTR
jgi:hypothetical protein